MKRLVLFLCTSLKLFSQETYDINKVLEFDHVMPVVVIGAGPAGLAASLYTVRGGFPTVIFAGEKHGGQLAESGLVENMLAIEKQAGKNIIINAESHVEDFGVKIIRETVNEIDLSSWPFTIATDEHRVKALAVIIATGSSPKYLGVAGEKKYQGMGVSTCALCDAHFFKNQDVAVVGGGDSAIEQALLLAPYVKSVTILNRSNKLRAAPKVSDRIKSYDNVKVLMNTKVTEIVGDGQSMTHLVLENTETGSKFNLDAQGLFLAIGHSPNTDLFEPYLDLTKDGHIILEDRSQKTSRPGVFSCGEAADHTYRQAMVAAGDGAKAGIDAVAFFHELGLNEKIKSQLKLATFEE